MHPFVKNVIKTETGKINYSKNNIIFWTRANRKEDYSKANPYERKIMDKALF